MQRKPAFGTAAGGTHASVWQPVRTATDHKRQVRPESIPLRRWMRTVRRLQESHRAPPTELSCRIQADLNRLRRRVPEPRPDVSEGEAEANKHRAEARAK